MTNGTFSQYDSALLTAIFHIGWLFMFVLYCFYCFHDALQWFLNCIFHTYLR